MLKTDTLVFIDWDDTLFPTRWVKTSEIDLKNPSQETIVMFDELDKLVTEMVVNISKLGKILIVTNGSERWINSCLNVFPKFKKIIENNITSVTSARDLFSEEYTVNMWKSLTFKMFFNEYISSTKGNYRILSYGDSQREHNAVEELKTYLAIPNQKRIIGSIKFMEYPSLNNLVTQLKIVNMLNEEITSIDDNKRYNLEDFVY